MIILSEIYTKLINCPDVPPETGGIIGINGNIVCECFHDSNSCEYNRAIYIPNVELLNDKIQQWQKINIHFAGIFHTHPIGQPDLSIDDISYINNIFQAVPMSVNNLYFPIVLPNLKLIPYKAIRFGDSIQVIEDKLKII